MRAFNVPSMTDPELATKVNAWRQTWVNKQVSAAREMSAEVRYNMDIQQLGEVQYQYQHKIDRADEEFQSLLRTLGVPA